MVFGISPHPPPPQAHSRDIYIYIHCAALPAVAICYFLQLIVT